ncbi:hypothetical protein J7M28_01910 [bacterium]|nr:hypothetical protein [bacterium]
MRKGVLLLLILVTGMVTAIATGFYVTSSPECDSSQLELKATTVSSIELRGPIIENETEELLAVTDCLYGGYVHSSYAHPSLPNTCVVGFEVKHLCYDEYDPDCCDHPAPNPVGFDFKRSDSEDWNYSSAPWWACAYDEVMGCYVTIYHQSLNLTKGVTYDFRFVCSGSLCIDPDVPAEGQTTGEIDCE